MIRSAFLWAMLSIVPLGFLCACGYTTQSSLDPKYQTIYVAPFENESREYGIQAAVTNAVRRKFIQDGRLQVVNRAEADLLLEGVIIDYQLRGITFDEDDDVTQFLTVITAGARCIDAGTGEIVWQDAQLAGETTFYTEATGQPSDRLRGNAEVFIPTVRSFASEEENRGASEALEQLSTDIFYRTVEPW